MLRRFFIAAALLAMVATAALSVVLDLVMEREGGDKPVLVAQAVYRWYD